MPLAVSDTDLLRLEAMLGVPRAPMVDDGVRTVIQFFREVLQTDPFDWFSYIRGIDFHSSVEWGIVHAADNLSRHKSRGPARPKPFVYFTTPGTSQYSTGTSFPESDYELFSVPYQMQCLKSRASGIKFSPEDQVVRLGGGAQYILSAADASRLVKLAGQ